MAKKTTKKKIDAVSKDQIELLIGGLNLEDMHEVEFSIGDQTTIIKVRPRLSLAERSYAVDEMADFCFVAGEYVPYMRDFGRMAVILTHYTNIDVDSLSMDYIWRLWNTPSFVCNLYDAIDDDVVAIYADAEKLVEWYKEQLLRSTKADDLYDVATKFVIQLESTLDKISDSIDSEHIGVNAKDLVSAVNAFKSMNEKDVAHAVLDYEEAKKKQGSKKTSKKKIVETAPAEKE